MKPFGLGNKEALRCKNMWTLGLALWMFDRDRAPIVDWLKSKFAKAPELAEANIAALNAGHAYGETVEMAASTSITSTPAPAEPASTARSPAPKRWRSAWSRAPARRDRMFFGSYPITPASPLLHHLVAAQGIRHHHLPGGGRDRRDLRRHRRHPMPASSESPPLRARVSRSRPRRSAWPS